MFLSVPNMTIRSVLSNTTMFIYGFVGKSYKENHEWSFIIHSIKIAFIRFMFAYVDSL